MPPIGFSVALDRVQGLLHGAPERFAQGLRFGSVLPECQVESSDRAQSDSTSAFWLAEIRKQKPTSVPSTKARSRLKSPMTTAIMSREPPDMWRSGRSRYRKRPGSPTPNVNKPAATET
jgi:hypothetical protein